MKLASYIDHTILSPDATKEQVKQICNEALQYKFASVCVNLFYTEYVREILKDEVKITTVIGFPLGAVTTEVKAFETSEALKKGADEIDMVINVGALKNKEYDYVKEDIRRVKEVCKNNILKVILETCLLTEEEKIKACELAVEAGADFVKTSTGFSKGGATVADIELMKKTVNGKAKVKASGGVRDYNTAVQMIKAGADRIGASASVSIVTGEKSEIEGY